jgi:AcrR family transcriptional regulator
MSSDASEVRETPLAPRRGAVQARAKDRVQRILEAAHRLLKSGGPGALTTPAIAREAKVPIGSLYQYFPNKESIVLALYETKLSGIRVVTSEPITPVDGDWRLGLRVWMKRLKQAEADIDFDLPMNEAVQHFQCLKDVARNHAAMQAKAIAEQLRALGSDWPDEALFDVAIHAFFINSSTWLYWSFAQAPLSQGVDRLVDCLIALLAPAIECEPPPPPPYASLAG